MAAIETEFKKFKLEVRREMALLRDLLAGKYKNDKWVPQEYACVLLNVKPRQLANIRVHEKDGKIVGSIGWKKGKGRNVKYYLPDIEKYNGAVTIMS